MTGSFEMLRDTNAEILRLHGNYLSRRSRRQFMRNARARAGVVSNIPIGVTNQPDLSRRPSPSLWGDCPWANIVSDPMFGTYVWDDFMVATTPSNTTPAIGTFGQWATWAASGTTITDAAEEGGVLKINGTTANKSFIITSNSGGFRMVGQNTFGATAYPFSGGKFWMEARIALGSVAASQQGVFFGLADSTGGQINASDTTIIASGGNTLTTTKNLIGFFNRTTTCPADFSVVYQPAGGTAVYPTSLTTPITSGVGGAAMVAYAAGSTSALANSVGVGQGTGFVKIGMVFDPAQAVPFLTAPTSPPSGQIAGTKYRPTITFYVNGVKSAFFLNPAILQASTFPNNCVFSPVFNYINIAGSTAPVYLDWIRIAALPSF
jgi:hypothetical protein